jgi:hypothetical protein
MTAQIAESLVYEGKQVTMCSTPLSNYFAFGGKRLNFDTWYCTALWRGYTGKWEILNGRLYLIGLHGRLEGGGEITLADVFPDYPSRAFAHWYSGTIRVPQGRQIEYVHMGFGSTYESDLIIELERGVVVDTKIRHNGSVEGEEGPEGYGVGAMTLFSRGGRSEEEESK